MAAITTEAQVCNLALGLLGHRQFIDDLAEDTPEGEACTVYFATVRNSLLERRDWKFASAEVVLALTTQERNGFGYAYAFPSDCLVPRALWTGERNPGAGLPAVFDKQLNDARNGFLLLCDIEEASLRYTVELATVALWPAAFCKAVGAELAVYLAGALPVKPELIRPLQGLAQDLYTRAAAIDAGGVQPDPRPEAEWIRGR